MAGIMVFATVSEARRAGFEVYDRTSDGYLVRTQTARGWALAIVRSNGAKPVPVEARLAPRPAILRAC